MFRIEWHNIHTGEYESIRVNSIHAINIIVETLRRNPHITEIRVHHVHRQHFNEAVWSL